MNPGRLATGGPGDGSRRLSAGRGTNLVLAGLLGATLLTGGLAFAIGGGWVRWAVVAHAVAGLAIVALAPWKSLIVRRGLRRRRRGSWASVALAILVGVAVVTGVGHATGLLRSFGGLSAMQVHVGSALASIPFAAWHVAGRPVRFRRTDLSRRAALRAGMLVSGSALTYGAIEGLTRVADLVGANRRSTGSYEQGSLRPELMPVTQWLDDRVPEIGVEAWTLVVRDAAGERRLSHAEIARFDDRVRAVLDCTGGWYAEQDWEGVSLARLLGDVGEARSLLVRSVTGYSRRFPIGEAGALLLATGVGGERLSVGHGFPARIVAPGRRGFWWVKWVTEVEASVVPWWWQPPFPLT